MSALFLVHNWWTVVRDSATTSPVVIRFLPSARGTADITQDPGSLFIPLFIRLGSPSLFPVLTCISESILLLSSNESPGYSTEIHTSFKVLTPSFPSGTASTSLRIHSILIQSQ